MASPHVKKNDTVVVIAGADKGHRGRVLELDSKKNRVIVEGVNTRKKHLRRNQMNPQGGIEERDCPIHMSNVMKEDVFDQRAARHGGASTDTQPQSKGE
ncbi:MAG: 50S ribosomal protein L24 [Verrucomicrobiota bacterium]